MKNDKKNIQQVEADTIQDERELALKQYAVRGLVGALFLWIILTNMLDAFRVLALFVPYLK